MKIHTFTHLADAFIQSDLLIQVIQVIHVIQCITFRLYIVCQYVCSLGIEPTTFALLTQFSTNEPQEHSTHTHSIYKYIRFQMKYYIYYINYWDD